MRILVADRNIAVRSAVVVYLQNMLELDTVREAGEGDDLLAQAELFRPDLVLLDWGWPGPARTQLLASLRACDPRPSVIVLGSLLDQRQDALAAGADHFVCKGDSPRRLLAAVRFVEADRGTGGSLASLTPA